MRFIVPDWPAPATIRAYTTTRHTGHSAPPFDSFNLAAHVGDNPNHVQQNRVLLMETLALPREPYWMSQVHGTTVISADKPYRLQEADAVFSHNLKSVCCVLTADCLPVLVCDKKGTTCAAIHAGWKGLAAGVIEACLAKLRLAPADTLVWLGPAIGPDAFLVDETVRQTFLKDYPEDADAFRPQGHDKWLANLYLLARFRLNRLDVQNIYGGDFCTWHEQQLFYSYRRESVTGRMASLIWIVV